MIRHARAHARRRSRPIVLASVVAALVLAGGPASAVIDGSRAPMKRETNESRRDHEIRRVRLLDAMSDLARRHSVKMARRGELFHTPDPASYYLKGKRWSTWGENVGYTTGTVEQLQRAFMRSAGHRSNILNRRFEHVAIGTVRRAGTLWVTVFFYG